MEQGNQVVDNSQPIEQAQPEVNQQPAQREMPPAVSQPQIKYAGFWIRYVAVIIDGLVLAIPGLIAGAVFRALSMDFMGTVVFYLIAWTYYILMTKEYGATLGKKALGIYVVSDKSENLSWGQVILRETLGKLVSMIILYIGYIMAGFSEKKHALHDTIANTTVIYKDPNAKNSCLGNYCGFDSANYRGIGNIGGSGSCQFARRQNKGSGCGN